MFDVKDYEEGVNAPPFHVYCRTTTVPYFDDDLQQEISNTRMARDTESGNSARVEDISYYEWYKKYVKDDDLGYNINKPIENQSDENIRAWIKHHDKKLNHEKYEEHNKNSKRYDGKKSYLIISEEETQKLINKKAGTGELRRDRKGNWTKKEFIINESEIGCFISNNSNLSEKTNRFSINYNNRGQVHIIPRRRIND